MPKEFILLGDNIIEFGICWKVILTFVKLDKMLLIKYKYL